VAAEAINSFGVHVLVVLESDIWGGAGALAPNDDVLALFPAPVLLLLGPALSPTSDDGWRADAEGGGGGGEEGRAGGGGVRRDAGTDAPGTNS
jgi:hypothetical protein